MKPDPITNILELADILDAMPHLGPDLEVGFDMNFDSSAHYDGGHPCGSACCIGGWVAYLNGESCNEDDCITEHVQSVSDMSREAAHALCWDGRALSSSVTPQQGAEAIRNAVEFDDPMWAEILGLEFDEEYDYDT